MECGGVVMVRGGVIVESFDEECRARSLGSGQTSKMIVGLKDVQFCKARSSVGFRQDQTSLFMED